MYKRRTTIEENHNGRQVWDVSIELGRDDMQQTAVTRRQQWNRGLEDIETRTRKYYALNQTGECYT